MVHTIVCWLYVSHTDIQPNPQTLIIDTYPPIYKKHLHTANIVQKVSGKHSTDGKLPPTIISIIDNKLKKLT